MSIENSDVELGRALYMGSFAGSRGYMRDGNGLLGNQAQMTGIALSDSVKGRVLVDMGGQTVAASQGVDLPCTVNVRAGDTCIITLVSGAPTVTGVVGRGDQQQDEINKADAKATQAQTDAKASLTAADLAKQVADAAKQQAQAVKDAQAYAQKLAEDAQQKANETITKAEDAQQKADQAVKNVDAANKAAQDALDKATTAAQDAAKVAGKSTVLVQSAAPNEDYQNDKTLWIDIKNGRNTPKVWGQLPKLTVADLAKMTVATASGLTVSQLSAGSGAMGWVNVTDSKAIDAAMAAALAQQTADGKNAIIHSMGEPTGDHAQGDQWWVIGDTGHVVGVRVWDGAQWVPYKLVVDELAVPSSVGTVSIKDGAISGDKLAVNSVQAKNITAGAVTADSIATGAITTGKLDMAEMTGNSAYLTQLISAIIKAGVMVAGDPKKAHVVMDGQGLTFYGTDGKTVNMQLQTGSGNIVMTGYATNNDLSNVSKTQIVDIKRWYYSSTSHTSLAGGKWVESYPGWQDKHYIWVRDDTTYGDGHTDPGTPVMLTGNTGATGPKGDPGTAGKDGAAGRGISGFSVAYAVSTSGTTAPSGGNVWKATVPTVPAGQYLWTRVTYTYTSGSPTSTYSVAKQGANGANGKDGANGKNGTNGRDGANGKMLYGTCATAAATAAKVATASGVTSLYAGLTVTITFANANSSDACTLNVSGTGAKQLWAWGAQVKRGVSWLKGSSVICVYDGTHWLVDSGSIASTALKPTSDGLYIWRYDSAGTPNNLYTLMTGDAMKICGKDGSIAAQFASDRIDLGKASKQSVISLCGEAGTIKYGQVDGLTGKIDSLSMGVGIGGNVSLVGGFGGAVNLTSSKSDSSRGTLTSGVTVEGGVVQLWAESEGGNAGSLAVFDNEAMESIPFYGLMRLIGRKNLYEGGGWAVLAANGAVYVIAQAVKTGGGSWDSIKCPYTLPVAYRPSRLVSVPVATANGGSTTGRLYVDTSGNIAVENIGSTGSSDQRFGALTYPVGL